MTDIEMLEHAIRDALPGVGATLRRPCDPNGEWWLDLKNGEHIVTVQWSTRLGFGVSAGVAEGYGEGPDEIYTARSDATARVLELLKRAGMQPCI